MVDEGGNKGIEERLALIAHLLTGILTKDMAKKDAVLALSGAGLAPKDVAGILGMTGNQVSVILHGARQSVARNTKSPTKGSAKV